MTRRGARLISELVRLSPISFTVSVAGALVFAAGTVASAVVVGRVTDRVLLPTFSQGRIPDGGLAWAIAAVVGVTVIRAVGVVLRRYFAALTAESAQIELRHHLVEAYLGLPLSWHQSVPAGQLLAHADNDTEVTTEVIHPLPFSLGVVFLAIGSAAALLAIDLVIAAVALLIFPALTVLNRVYSNRVEGPSAEVQAAVGRVSAIAHESFDGALVVKTLGRAADEEDRFNEAAEELRRRRIQVGYLRAVFESVMDALPTLGFAVVVVVGAYRIQAGAMTNGDLVQVAALFTVLAMPMRVFGFFLETVPPSVVAHQRLATVFDQEVPTPTGVMAVDGNGPLGLAAHQLGHHYDDGHRVLDGVTLEVRPGEVVAVVGSTGAGKSTLCTLLAGLVPPRTGRLEVWSGSGGNDGGGDGTPGPRIDLDRVDPDQRRAAVALVFQESFLFADTLRANVDLEGTATDAEITGALTTARVDGLVEQLPAGLETVVGERGVTLSGGQRQRVAMARALLRAPRLLILDDATSAVDAVVEREILDRLRSDLRATTIIVAQRVSTIELADRVLYLDQGRVRASGTHPELLADPGYRALVSAYEQAIP
jgi:ABC-type multidrug transport system fused ATPase/permease subunit